MVGMGGAICDTLGIVTGREPIACSVTLGARTEQSLYKAELAAMVYGNEAATTTSGWKTDHHYYKQSVSTAGNEPTKTSIRTNQH
jgi:hypothetical protein